MPWINSSFIIDFDEYRRPMTYALLLTVTIPAIVCTLVILTFFYLRWHSMIQKSLHHHAIFLLIIISFLYTVFDLPFTINYLRLGYHSYRSVPFCLAWYWFDYSLLNTSLSLMATASIQRHILVFHSRWLQSKKRRWAMHYIPLLFSAFYPSSFYFVFMFLYPCTIYFNESYGTCAYPCYIDNTLLYNIDWILNTITPVFVIVFANVLLIVRVIRLMSRVRRNEKSAWEKQKKLTFQLLVFSSLYVVAYVPTTTVAVLRTLAFPDLYDIYPNIYNIYHMIQFVCPLQSFLCVLALPELIEMIKFKARQISTRSIVRPVLSPSLRPMTIT